MYEKKLKGMETMTVGSKGNTRNSEDIGVGGMGSRGKRATAEGEEKGGERRGKSGEKQDERMTKEEIHEKLMKEKNLRRED